MTLLTDWLRDDQREILTHPATIKVLSCGRRWGKTFSAGLFLLEFAKAGAACAWVAPTYKNSRPLWRFCEATINSQAVKLHKAEREIDFPSGGRIGIYSADNDVSMRGEAFDLVIVDEAAQCKSETFTDVLLPTLADRNGRIILISTPKGKNWFYEEFNKAKSVGAAWNAPSNANPSASIQRAYELARERVSQRTFRQEWDAQFIEHGGEVFRDVRACATATRQEPRPGVRYVIGADWGRTNDATVFTVLDVESKTMVAIDRMTDTDYNLQRTRLTALAQRYNQALVIAESNAMGLPNIEALQMQGVRVEKFDTNNASKARIIDALALAFESRHIQIVNDITLLNELEAYASEQLPSGLIRYSAPSGLHDDCVMSLALAWHGVAHNQVSMKHFARMNEEARGKNVWEI